MLSAFPLGLVLSGTMNITLADGSTHVRLTCRGMVEIDGSKRIGLVTLETGASDVLVGMEFIAKFEKQLVVCPKNASIELVDSPASTPASSAKSTPTICVSPSESPHKFKLSHYRTLSFVTASHALGYDCSALRAGFFRRGFGIFHPTAIFRFEFSRRH